MRKMSWQLTLGISLAVLSAVLYLVHFAIFRDAHHIFIYLLGDIAFVPIEVLMVTLIIHRVLSVREKRALLKKMNMVIGAFFSEVGNRLLRDLVTGESESAVLAEKMDVRADWKTKQFARARKFVEEHDFDVDARKVDLPALRRELGGHRDFLLGLLQNPNLLEHGSFTDLLWGVFHLAEELQARPSLEGLPETDMNHLSGDLKRAYTRVAREWISYMQHLQGDYPYLFSLAVRTSPFAKTASVVVQ